MHLSRLILSIAAILLIVGMYFLPKVVVDDQDDQEGTSISVDSSTETEEAHIRELSDSEAQLISDLKEHFKNQNNTQKSATFADSLAGIFAELNYLDSAAVYREQALQLASNQDRLLQAAEAHFEAYSYSLDLKEQEYWGQKARSYFQQLLDIDPQMNDAKAKIALTYLPQQPMQAVVLLREVLEKDPDNVLALYNLGLLSLQSNQFDRAVQRFEKLIAVDSTNLEGQFYLGVAYFESGNRDRALAQFLKVQEMDGDEEIKANTEEYLKELK